MATAKKSPAQPAAAKTVAPAAPAAKKPAKAAAPKAAAPAPVAKATKPAAKRKKAAHTVPQEQRAHYIEVAAFYIAERRGFAPGDPMDDWLAAETEIDQLLAEGRLG